MIIIADNSFSCYNRSVDLMFKTSSPARRNSPREFVKQRLRRLVQRQKKRKEKRNVVGALKTKNRLLTINN